MILLYTFGNSIYNKIGWQILKQSKVSIVEKATIWIM